MDKKGKWLIGVGLLLGAAAAAIAIRLLGHDDYKPEKPPRNAPQLNIDNPGTQADFPTTASESEVG